jgi:hypothetical protein
MQKTFLGRRSSFGGVEAAGTIIPVVVVVQMNR